MKSTSRNLCLQTKKNFVSDYKTFIFLAARKHIIKVSLPMSGLTKSAFSLLKANEKPGFSCIPVYFSLIFIKRAKLEDVRSLFKYLGEDTIEFISAIPEKSRNDAGNVSDVMD